MEPAARPIRTLRKPSKSTNATSLSLRIATAAGLNDGPKTKHLNAKVTPALFAAAAAQLGTQSPSAVIEAALAALATQDDLGPWLADQWGSLAHVDPDILAEMNFRSDAFDQGRVS